MDWVRIFLFWGGILRSDVNFFMVESIELTCKVFLSFFSVGKVLNTNSSSRQISIHVFMIKCCRGLEFIYFILVIVCCHRVSYNTWIMFCILCTIYRNMLLFIFCSCIIFSPTEKKNKLSRLWDFLYFFFLYFVD